MKRIGLFLMFGALFAFLAAGTHAQDRSLARARTLTKELYEALQREWACENIGALVNEYYVGKGLSLGAVVNAIYDACDDMEGVIQAALAAGASPDVMVQALVFAGADPVDVARVLANMRQAEGEPALGYVPPPVVMSLDPSTQVAPPPIAPVLWGSPVRDAGPDRTRPLSPSSPSRPSAPGPTTPRR